MKWLLALIILVLLLNGCKTDQESSAPPAKGPVAEPTAVEPVKIGCAGCHEKVQLDKAHSFACTTCHNGKDQESRRDIAHTGLIARPSHPERMAATCGSCHPMQVEQASRSLHFTLAKKINAIRMHFGAADRLNSPLEVPVTTEIATAGELADDMLRRRCLRCHVYANGDEYPAVTHGTGCSACHLAFQNGKLQSHAFVAPQDNQCLSCHYGNFVGNDYYGRYEHDYNWEYRTPYTTSQTVTRPYGVETHNLVPDIHQQRGLVCMDCHQTTGHTVQPPVTCIDCHGWRPGRPLPKLNNLALASDALVLRGSGDGREHPVPALRHPAHQQYGPVVDCQVCHAQWSFNDAATHLLLSKIEDYEPWERLTVQSSSEIERILEHNLHGSSPLPLTMRDGLTGEPRPGIWLQGFGQRRWESMPIARDADGRIKVFRPLLDLRLSLIEANGQAPFDNLSGNGSGLRPYTPHTTGPAGLFYLDRFRHLLPPENK